MTKIKLCGLMRPQDIAAANLCRPDFIGFVFAPGRRRTVTPGRAEELRRLLSPGIKSVGVFVNDAPEAVAELLNRGIIDLAQLHGSEDEGYIAALRRLTEKPIIKAFRIASPEDAERAEASSSDLILMDSGTGTGKMFDWSLIRGVKRPYFLAGGLSCDNIREAVRELRPFGVDVSSGIETNGVKDSGKMAEFCRLVREEIGK